MYNEEGKRLKLKKNAIKCNHCGDIIESTDRHEFVQCSCKKVFVAGGSWYQRVGYTDLTDFESLAEYEAPK